MDADLNRAPPIELSDLQLLVRSDSPDLADTVIAFLDQEDPGPQGEPPAGALTLAGLQAALSERNLRWKSKAERRKLVQETWARFLSQPDLPPPPRFGLTPLLLELYARGTPQARASLIDILLRAELRFGLWGGIKRIYKIAEKRLDPEILGALACRFDIEATRHRGRDVSTGTLVYLRRRAWRFLRQIGAAVPGIYPQFAVQVLRHYGENTRWSSTWVANHIWAHHLKKQWGKAGLSGKLPQDLVKHRAFDEAWKRSPEPLMLLLESCQADAPARFAIQGLRRDFPEVLRKVTPAWLERLARRPLESAHEFLIETLQGSPEFHQGRLRALGLHEAVLLLLDSPSQKARAYAIEYARAHAADLPAERLCDLLESEHKETVAYAAATLKGRPPRALGHVLLGRLLNYKDTAPFAKKALAESFERHELPEAFLIDMLYGSDEQREWAEGYIKAKYPNREISADFWKRAVADPRHADNYEAVEVILEALGKYPLASLGAGWLLDALMQEDIHDQVAEWLEKADALPGLDVERVKGLVFHGRYRALALRILGNTKLVRPRDLSLPWLLALARRADPALHEFAHRYLLLHWKPADFSDAGDKNEGTARLFQLATAEKEPEPVRLFAHTYLRCHHPVLGPEQPEAKSIGLKPQLPRAAYTAERIWPALFDSRPDVRRFAVAITKAELRAWGHHTRAYELCEAEAREVRAVGYEALLRAGEADADLACTLKPEELEADRVFPLTQSRHRTTREVGMELIRRHYDCIGGAERLAWLMESPDREVRLCAVRLLWERHRPLHLPPGWKPQGLQTGDAPRTTPFADVAALQGFLRRVLFGVPPGRSMEPRESKAVRRRLPQSAAKRHVVEVVRDLAVEDEGFARLVRPVLAEFTGSLARGEWQACLQALVQIENAHAGLAQEVN
jgi:hypothetical protein